jgi:hypothetical protein
MTIKIKAWFGLERNRAYLYRVATGAGAVAFSYGLVTADEIFVWSGFVATLFGLPAANTSTERKP